MKTKGDRLKWVALKEAKSVKLTAELAIGKVIDLTELSKRRNRNKSNLIII